MSYEKLKERGVGGGGVVGSNHLTYENENPPNERTDENFTSWDGEPSEKKEDWITYT